MAAAKQSQRDDTIVNLNLFPTDLRLTSSFNKEKNQQSVWRFATFDLVQIVHTGWKLFASENNQQFSAIWHCIRSMRACAHQPLTDDGRTDRRMDRRTTTDRMGKCGSSVCLCLPALKPTEGLET